MTLARTTFCVCPGLGRLAPVAAIACLMAFTAGCGNFSAQGKNAEGVRLYQQARFDEALRQFESARYDDPDNADAYYNLAATLHRLAHAQNRPEDLRQAEHYYRMCLDRNNDHRECYRGLAVLMAEQGRTDEGYYLLQGWIERHPTSADSRIELARLCEEFGEPQRARSHLQEALALQPQNPRALAALGKIREESGERAQALAAYRESYALDNRQPELASRILALQTSVPSTGAPAGHWATGGTYLASSARPAAPVALPAASPTAPAVPSNNGLRWVAQPTQPLR